MNSILRPRRCRLAHLGPAASLPRVPIEADLAALLAHVPTDGSSAGNGSLRTGLDWDKARYATAKDDLVTSAARSGWRSTEVGMCCERSHD
jgi:hypothetical protein